MPFVTRINQMDSIPGSEGMQLIYELQFLRAELDDIRSAFINLRALLIAATAVGAGYNTAPTNLGVAKTQTPAQASQFTAN